MVSGCASVRDFHADSRRVAECDVVKKTQVEVFDVRTGLPLLSTPHRMVCYLNAQNQIVWITETSTEASLQAFSDLPSAAIQRGIPTSTVGY